MSDACWALSYVTDGSTDRIQAVMDAGAVPRVVELLGRNEIACVVSVQRDDEDVSSASKFYLHQIKYNTLVHNPHLYLPLAVLLCNQKLVINLYITSS